MDTPEVSILIPAYNAERYIGHALESIRSQKLQAWEVVVTEDGTKDRTEEIGREFSRTIQQRVVYNRHSTNRGLPSTRNTGISASRGQWIAFRDADDAWEPDHLARLVERAVLESADLVFSGSKLMNERGDLTGATRVPSEEQLRSLPEALFTGKLSIMPSSVLIQREAFERFGLISTEFRRVNDTEYWLRVLHRGGKVSYSGKATCRYRWHAASLTQRAPVGQFVESARVCEEYADWNAIPHRVRRSRPSSLYRWAAYLAAPSDLGEAQQLCRQALRLQPLNPKNLFCYLRLASRRFASARTKPAIQSSEDPSTLTAEKRLERSSDDKTIASSR